MTAAIKKDLYYSYIITSQSYSVVKLVNSSKTFNKLDVAVKLINAIIGAECYIGSNTSFCTTNHH